MRKLIWCCLSAGVLATGSFLSLAYYACCCPDSLVGHSMQVIAAASIAVQPLSGLTSLAVRTNHAAAAAQETTPPIDECIPDDPQPVALEPKEEVDLTPRINKFETEAGTFVNKFEPEAAPIVISEDDPLPREEVVSVVPAPIEVVEIPPKGCPVRMPYCQDDEDEPVPTMPRADAGEETEHTVFKAWMELFEESKESKKDKSPSVEELPPPTEEESQAEPKCQEDSHLYEQYPGCPRTTSPYRSKGKEESSEEPPHPDKKSHHDKDREVRPRTKGVDTMEYRKSDAGLDEFGPGPLH